MRYYDERQDRLDLLEEGRVRIEVSHQVQGDNGGQLSFEGNGSQVYARYLWQAGSG